MQSFREYLNEASKDYVKTPVHRLLTKAGFKGYPERSRGPGVNKDSVSYAHPDLKFGPIVKYDGSEVVSISIPSEVVDANNTKWSSATSDFERAIKAYIKNPPENAYKDKLLSTQKSAANALKKYLMNNGIGVNVSGADKDGILKLTIVTDTNETVRTDMASVFDDLSNTKIKSRVLDGIGDVLDSVPGFDYYDLGKSK